MSCRKAIDTLSDKVGWCPKCGSQPLFLYPFLFQLGYSDIGKKCHYAPMVLSKLRNRRSIGAETGSQKDGYAGYNKVAYLPFFRSCRLDKPTIRRDERTNGSD